MCLEQIQIAVAALLPIIAPLPISCWGRLPVGFRWYPGTGQSATSLPTLPPPGGGGSPIALPSPQVLAPGWVQSPHFCHQLHNLLSSLECHLVDAIQAWIKRGVHLLPQVGSLVGKLVAQKPHPDPWFGRLEELWLLV